MLDYCLLVLNIPGLPTNVDLRVIFYAVDSDPSG